MSEARPVITIYPDRAANTWMAWFHDSAEVVELFGSDVLPTGFTLSMLGEDVQLELANLNPRARVRLIDLDGLTFEDS